jgi:hypothetical protein
MHRHVNDLFYNGTILFFNLGFEISIQGIKFFERNIQAVLGQFGSFKYELVYLQPILQNIFFYK